MRKRSAVVVLGIVVLIFLTSFAVVSCGKNSRNTGQKKETVYDRVVEAGKIRCGYVIYPPGSLKDPNTGKLSGISIETLEAAGKNMELEIEWTEEVGWGTMIEGLLANRYDMIGSPVWANSTRGKLVDFSAPLFYSAIGVYVRHDDDRFTNNLQTINSENVRIATIDGEMSDIIAQAQFPKAQRVSLTQLSDVSQILLSVAQKKADVTFVEPVIGYQFLKNNQDTVKNIAAEKPIRIFPNTMMFRRGEMEFKAMLNTALEELINGGFVDELLDKYEEFPGTLYRPAYPYQVPGR